MTTTAKKAAPRAQGRKQAVRAVVARPFTGIREGDRVFYAGETFEGSTARVAELREKGFLKE